MLLEGSPGVGKTSLVQALGAACGVTVVRINPNPNPNPSPNPSPNPNPSANPNQAELAALFELLGDGGGVDGHGAPDADVDSVTIGYEEFCDLLKRLDPEWQEDQLDDALMALVGDISARRPTS